MVSSCLAASLPREMSVEEYEKNLEIAKSDAKLVQMPTKFDEPFFKERWNIAQLSVKVIAELRQAEAQLFDLLAGRMGPSNVLLSASSEWAKENNQHTFIELLAYYRNNVLAVNPTNIKAIKAVNLIVFRGERMYRLELQT